MTRSDSELRPAGERSLEAVREAVSKNPLAAAPASLRRPVWKLWTLHAHLFPTALPLAAAVGAWVDDFGLTEADAGELLAAALRPDRMAGYRFASDLMCDLSQRAAALIDRRRHEAADQAARRRTEAEAVADPPLEPAAVRAVIEEWRAGFGLPAGTEGGP